MARYLARHIRGRRSRNQRRIYIISALLIIAVVVAFIYGLGSSGKDKGEGETVQVLMESEATDEMQPLASEPILSEVAPEPVLLEVAPEPTSEPNSQVAKLVAEAMALVNTKPPKIIEARDRLNEILPMPMGGHQQSVVKKQLSELADKWLFTRTVLPQDRLCSTYKVEGGDQLRTIGRRFKVPYEILMQINKINRPEALQAGGTIKVINGPFHVRVYRSTFTMDLYVQNTFVRSFPVGLGKQDMETPMGLWAVKADGKLISPTWTDPMSGKTYEAEDPDYPLGSRWIGLEGIKGEAVGRTGFAIHGTKNPEEIGMAGSQGCIRLLNGDAILVYNLLVPKYSRVEIVE
jgi:LysM repeat protein